MTKVMPWEQSQSPVKGNLVLCHVNTTELKALNLIQGEEIIDSETGAPSFEKLSGLLSSKEILQILFKLKQEVQEDIQDGHLSGNLKFLNKVFELSRDPSTEKGQAKNNFERLNLEREGTDGDTRLVWLPKDLILVFNALRDGQVVINPNDGFLMFGGGGFFGKILKIAAPVVALAAAPFTGGSSLALLGNAALAAGASYAANRLTGENHKDSFKSGLMAGAGSAGGQFLNGTLGINPMLAHGGSRLVAGLVGGEDPRSAVMNGFAHGAAGHYGATGGVAGMFSSPLSKAIPGSAAALMGATNQLPQVSTNQAGVINPASIPAPTPLQPQGAQQPAQSGLWSLLEKAAPYIPSLMEIGGKTLTANAYQQAHKDERKRYLEEMAAHKAERAANLKRREDHWSAPAVSSLDGYKIRSSALGRRHGVYSVDGYRHGGPVKVLDSSSQGALIQGPGGGQDDEIPALVPADSYIIDASTTSMLGDGTTQRGAEVLRKFEKMIGKRKTSKSGKESYSVQPVYLSDGEYKIAPQTVKALGRGNIDRGSKILKKMVKNIRKQKSRNGSGLPPKALPITSYLRKG